MAEYMNRNVPGVRVPEDLIQELKKAPKGEALQVGVRIAGRTMKTIKDKGLCDGVHMMAIGREELVPEILKEAGLDSSAQN